MAQFDVHQYQGRGGVRLVLDVQASILETFATRVAVPLRRVVPHESLLDHLNPVFEIDGAKYYLCTQEIAVMPARRLGPVRASLSAHRDTIIDAIDMLVTGH